MKNLLYLLFISLSFTACKDDSPGFDVRIEPSDISFRPIAGGAIMYYKLPSDDEVFSLKIRYVDAQGKSVTRMGSYACDSLEINGFNEANEGVRALVSLCNRQNAESEPVGVTFTTLESAPYAFFNKAEVKPYWNGFTLSYEGAPDSKGLAHVFFTGVNPRTQAPDTLLVKTFPIESGKREINFSLENPNPSNTVVVRTEDYRGYRARQQIWENVESYSVELLSLDETNFIDPHNLVKNQEEMGVKYLFDGDRNGVKTFEHSTATNKFFTFVAGPHAKGKPFIVDFKQERLPADVRIYSMLYVRDFSGRHPIWYGDYQCKVPSSVTIYASNDKDDDDSWVRLASFEEPNNTSYALRWCSRGPNGECKLINEIDLVRNVPPCFISIPVPVQATEFRYLKFVVDELFLNRNGGTGNPNEYITFNELEIYVKK